MSCGTNSKCNDTGRLKRLLDVGANGISAVEIVPKAVSDSLFRRVIQVFFYAGVPANLQNTPEKVWFDGGTRVQGGAIKAQTIVPSGNSVIVTLTIAGDLSDYTIHIDHDDLDPQFRCAVFNFGVGCAKDFDCVPALEAPPALPPDPAIDYLARDYQSFRRALLDFLPTRVPGFQETSEADLAITLAELFAYAGDQLSYFQDAVANEAWFDTARQRRSVRRHAQLVDYRVHEGLAARVVLHFRTTNALTIPRGFPVTTIATPLNPAVVFETDQDVTLNPGHQDMVPYTWLDNTCCLPQGSTYIEVEGDHTSLKNAGLLLIEEVAGVVTEPDGTMKLDPVAADPRHRQIVRITDAVLLQDSLPPGGPIPLTRVSWRKDDALIWDACLSLNGVQGIGLNGNLVRASHGKTVLNEVVDLDSMTLQQGPLTWLYSQSPDSLFPPDVVLPREAVSTIQLTVNGEPWFEQPSLLDSKANDPDFVVETDDSGRGVLRFGNGDLGRRLPAAANVIATYRVGNGTAGNVGYETLVVAPIGLPAGVSSVNNPLPAVDGIDPEDLAVVRRDAPQAFRRLQYRAVTIDDYAAATRRVPGVFDAAAYFRWTGSWLTVFVAVDPAGRLDLTPALSGIVVAQLETYRQAGYDLEVRGPDYVPLDIEMTVCVLPDYFQADVMREVQMRLATMSSSGFFSPNQFTFGQSLYLSRLLAAVQDIAGVKGVHATIFKKLFSPAGNELFDGVIRVGNLQIIRADSDPSRPENGRVVLTPEGGK